MGLDMTKSPFHALQISDHVYWVGAVDWNLRDFHGYATERGTTYNAFLIVEDKVTLVDLVRAPFRDEMMSRIASVLPPEEIDYIVSNHAEMDHSGALPATIRTVRPEKVFASAKGAQALEAHFHTGDEITVVKDGESISLGDGNITFYETRMLHWPDSMFSFYDTDGVLFTQDAFGMHMASAERFADELDPTILGFEAAKYFANILTPYAQRAAKLLGQVAALNLHTKIIAPDHGPVYRENLNWILDLYSRFAQQKPTKKAVIAYATMWDSTGKMARAIAEGIVEGGCAVEFFDMGVAHRSNVATALLDAGAFVAGSPTMNNMVLPAMADLLSYVQGLRFKNLTVAAFGSYGWGGGAIAQIEKTFEAMKLELVSESVKVKYVPTDDDLARCFEVGAKISERLTEICEE